MPALGGLLVYGVTDLHRDGHRGLGVSAHRWNRLLSQNREVVMEASSQFGLEASHVSHLDGNFWAQKGSTVLMWLLSFYDSLSPPHDSLMPSLTWQK